jgi:hypothetical protein
LGWVLPLSFIFIIGIIWYVIHRNRKIRANLSQQSSLATVASTGSEISPVYNISETPPTPMPSNNSEPKVKGGWFEVFNLMSKL